MTVRPIIIAYDISAHAVRRRVRKILNAWRVGGQLSVHECRLSQADAEELFLQIGEEIDPRVDRLLFAWIDRARPPVQPSAEAACGADTILHIK